MRSEVLQHAYYYGIDREFANILLYFSNQITNDELLDLYTKMQKPNFGVLKKMMQLDSDY
jgi:hypothetical protein